MYDDEFGDMDGVAQDPPPTKTVKESIVAIAIALGVCAVVFLVLQVHFMTSFIGTFTWIAATIVPSFFAAHYVVTKLMGVSFHVYVRLIVGVIIFFSVAVFIAGTLEAHHLR